MSNTSTLQSSIELHIRVNCYPPLPHAMAPVLAAAVTAAADGDTELEIDLQGICEFRGKTTAPAIELVEHAGLRDFVWDLQDDNWDYQF